MVKKTYSYSFFVFTEFALVCCGLLLSLYLLISHYRNYTDPAYSSFCAISRAINCDTVSQSTWSVMLGLPVALWGGIAYLVYFVFLLQVRRKGEADEIWSLLFVFGVLYSISSLFFGYISALKINSFCIFCVATYAINFLLPFQTWLLCKRSEITYFPPSLTMIGGLIVGSCWLKRSTIVLCFGVVSAILFIPHYWQFDRVPDFAEISHGTTDDGQPWLGADDPAITIDLFSDYQCFQCYKTQYILRNLIQANPGKIKLIYHHYPMDHKYNSLIVPEPFHIGSGKMAILAIYAASKGKFWEVSDILYDIGRTKGTINVSQIAESIGLSTHELVWALESKQVAERLRYDIWHGMKLGITGTPSFVIDGEVYTGFIPPEILQKALGK